jgi:hypothetical protein
MEGKDFLLHMPALIVDMIDAFIYKAVFRSHSLFGGVLEAVLTVHNPSEAIENRVGGIGRAASHVNVVRKLEKIMVARTCQIYCAV